MIDLDGTLTPTDTLVEGMVALVRHNPLQLLHLPPLLRGGRAVFKDQIARRTELDPALLPYNEELLAYLREQKAQGRTLVLATAANIRVAQAVADHLNVFDKVMASSDVHNLKGARKLAAIQHELGMRFSYAGDSRADLPIWRAAETALLVGVSPTVRAALGGGTTVEWQSARRGPRWRVWLKELRVHQWLKNLLLFVALITSFTFTDTARVLSAILGFVAFSLAASATYVANDLWDLDHDRAHPRKRLRPLASGAIPIEQGVLVAGLSMIAALSLAAVVGTAFTATLCAYIVLTLAYSWHLKRFVVLDVMVLAVLFTLRVVAGAAAISVSVSTWLLAFSIFIFFSLALVKRCSELVVMQERNRDTTPGRDYRLTDLAVLWPLGVASGMASVVVLGLFISSPDVQQHYATPQLLWLAGLALIYWLGRLWIKTARGEMHDDPLVFAVTDRTSLLTMACVTVAVMAARFIQLELLP